MGKRSKKQVIGMTKKQASMSVRDQRARMQVNIGLAVAAVIVVGLIAAGVINHFIIQPSSPVATVNGERITTEAYQKMVKYQRNSISNYLASLESQKAQFDPEDANNQFMVQYYDQMITQAQQELANIGPSVLDQMINDVLIRQAAQREGIEISEQQIDEEIERAFGFERNPPTPTATATPAPTTTPDSEATATPEGTAQPTAEPAPTEAPMTEEQFQERYNQYLANLKATTGFSEADYRELVRGVLYRQELQQVLADRVPTSGEQVWARHILVADEETAKSVLERLEAGEEFEALAAELSTDSSNKDQGGDLGWFARGSMVEEFEDAAFSLGVGEISDPVKTEYGYHIIKVEDHQQDREYDDTTLQQMQSEAYDDWLADAIANADIQRTWSPDKVPPEPTPILPS